MLANRDWREIAYNIMRMEKMQRSENDKASYLCNIHGIDISISLS